MTKRRIFNKEIKDKIISLYEKDLHTIIEIEKIVGLCRTHIHKILREANIDTSSSHRSIVYLKSGRLKIWNTGLTKETSSSVKIISEKSKGHVCPSKMNFDSKELVKLYNEGITVPKLALKFNCSIGPIGRILKEEGICLSLKGKPKPKSQTDKMVETRMKEGSYVNQMKDKNYEEIYGEERANEIKNKSSNTRLKLFADGKIEPWNKRKTHEEDNRILAGENHPLFNNWASLEPYGEEFNNKMKNKIRKRDNQVCMNCGKHREKLSQALAIHHINYDKNCNIPENFICLCRNCHALTTNSNRGYWTKFFQDKLSKLYGYKYSESGKIILNF